MLKMVGTKLTTPIIEVKTQKVFLNLKNSSFTNAKVTNKCSLVTIVVASMVDSRP